MFSLIIISEINPIGIFLSKNGFSSPNSSTNCSKSIFSDTLMFTLFSTISSNLPGQFITDIAFDPKNDNNIIVTYG